MTGADLHTAVLGAGSWGTALAALAARQSATLLWARDPQQAQAINSRRTNPRYLSDVTLPQELASTASFEQAVEHACRSPAMPGLIILGVPVAGLEQTCAALAQTLTHYPGTRPAIIWTCKGFDPDTGRLPHQIALAQLKDLALPGVLSGPSFAHEVVRGLPVALTVASQHAAARNAVITALHGQTARVYTSADIIGVEVGGALKNIIAIACGIADGLALGANARAALITRGLAEIQRLGVCLGGMPDTFFGLTGLGDLVLTATGDLSRNRQVGLALARGETLEHILASGMTAEGVRCARAALALGQKYDIDMPIIQIVCQVLFEGLTPSQAVADLLSRQARDE